MSEGSKTGSSRVESIAGLLRSQILSGKYAPGERLPSERELATRLGGSRNSAREAFKQLEHEGMITIRRGGGGARVRPLEDSVMRALYNLFASTRLPREEVASQWLDLYEIVFAATSRLAVERASEEEHARAKAIVSRLSRDEASDAELVATIGELTELMTLASRNVVLRLLRDALTGRPRPAANGPTLAPATRRAFAKMGSDVARALDRRDAAAVEGSVRELLRAWRRSVLGGLSQERQ